MLVVYISTQTWRLHITPTQYSSKQNQSKQLKKIFEIDFISLTSAKIRQSTEVVMYQYL